MSVFIRCRKSGSQAGRRFSGHTQDGGWFSTAPISDGFYDAPRATMRSLTRTSSLARSVSSQATYRDPFNGSLTTAPRSYLRSVSSAPPPLPSSVTSWRSALEEAITSARAPLASLPQTLAHPAKENVPRHSHAGEAGAPCFHCEEAVQARAHQEKLEAGKQAAELEARQARAEVAAGAAREAVLEGQLEALRRKVADAIRVAEAAEKAAGEEHEAALAAAAEWRKKSLEEARKHAAELAALSDAMKEQWRQGAAAEEQARKAAESAHAAEREELKARARELEKDKEKAEAALRASDEQAKETAARLLKLDEAVDLKTQELRRQLDEMHDRHRLLQGDAEALRTALEVAKQTETALRGQLDDAGAALAACQAEVESVREESHRWRRECRDAQEAAREMAAHEDERRRRKEERAALPFEEVREELENAMARALDRHGVPPAAEGLSDDEYLAAMARLEAQRAQTEKQRQSSLVSDGVDVAALQRAAAEWAARRGGAAGTGRARAVSLPAHWEHRRERLEAVPRAKPTGRQAEDRPLDAGPGNFGGQSSAGPSSVESSPEHALGNGRRQSSRHPSRPSDDGRTGGHFADGAHASTSVRVPEPRGSPEGAGRASGAPSRGSSVRSSPSRDEEGSELADSDWAAPRPPRKRVTAGGAAEGRGPLSC
ncbi:hypothetical protein KFL_000010100 [Klebsormidium nitens]|uniref:Cilium assembly protein DZIP1 domain-containing protein n=1 Tax=Klebsormidium nitens TaxID=105231 RepID=A0A0U9HHN2_KLENI|nr:hypothetical protein KFL_000010100 [Klebsormidium nitens]|eukprot:GAQ77561.1 hypothetical protein KFL_000010100 [Klebsormidium nitens]